MKKKQTKRKKKTPVPQEPVVEIVRSFSFKKNLGNYQSADFFASAKVQCKVSELEDKSESLYDFCKREVTKSVNALVKEKERSEKIKQGEAVEPIAPRTKDDFIAEAIAKKRNWNDDENTNGQRFPVAGGIEERTVFPKVELPEEPTIEQE